MTDTVPQQSDGWNCGFHMCWNARCFILCQCDNLSITYEALYKNDNDSVSMVNEQIVNAQLNLVNYFNYTAEHIVSVRLTFFNLMKKLTLLVTSEKDETSCVGHRMETTTDDSGKLLQRCL